MAKGKDTEIHRVLSLLTHICCNNVFQKMAAPRLEFRVAVKACHFDKGAITEKSKAVQLKCSICFGWFTLQAPLNEHSIHMESATSRDMQ